jgi:LSD1 subclass zinc finger protein
MIDNKYRGPIEQPAGAHIIRCAECNKRAIIVFESCLGFIINEHASDDLTGWLNPGKRNLWFCPECQE